MSPRLRIGIPPCTFLLLVFLLVGAAAFSLPGSEDSEFLIPRVGGGENHTCVIIDDDGGLRCFGDNTFGQLGNDGESTDEFVDPTQYGDFSDSPNGFWIYKRVEQVGVGGAHTCVLTNLKKLLCWGSNSHGQTGLALNISIASVPTILEEYDTSISYAPQVSLGYQHTCVLFRKALSQKLRCWGRNSEGQLGNGYVSSEVSFNSSTPLSLDFSYVSAGWYHTCALTFNESVKCWGDNTYGQLGRGSQTPLEATPDEVMNISNVKAVSAGRRHTCIIHGEVGKVLCFGSNAHNQVDDDNNSAGNVTSPAAGKGVLGGALWVSAGFDHTCALAINDSSSSYGLYCWGSDTVGQLGMGTGDPNARVSSVPQPPSPLSDAINLVAGHQRSYLLIANHTTTSFNSDGTNGMQSTSNQLWGWGSGSDGVLGPNAPNDEYDVPLVVYPSLQTLVVDDIILQANDVLSIVGDMIMSNNISTSISVIKDDFSASTPATAAMNISGCASFGGDLLLSLSTTPNASDQLLEIVLVAYDSLCENYTRFQSVQVNLTITPSASTASASSRAPIGRERRGGQCTRETYGERSYSVLIDPSECGDEEGDGGVADGGGDDGNVQTLVLAIAVPLACCLAIISVVALVCILAAALLCTALVGGGVTSIAAMREINFDGEDLDGIYTTASSMEDSS